METERIKILAIDDHADNLISLKALILESFGDATIFTALDGVSGVELAAKEIPDVILLDIVMPNMDGFAVCEKLKADVALRDIPVIFITALKCDTDCRLKALDAGGEAFLSKPIDKTELVAQIRTMLKINAGNKRKLDEKRELAALVEEQTKKLQQSNEVTIQLLADLRKENDARKHSEAVLRQREERLRTITENAPNIIVELDRSGRIVFMSRVMAGYNMEDVIGQNFCKWTPEAYHAIMNQSLALLFSSGLPQTFQVQGAGAHGEIRWYLSQLAPVRVHGVVQNAILTASDITDRIRDEELIKESEKKRVAILQTAMDGFCLIDMDARLLEVNETLCKMCGYSHDELLGMLFSDLEVIESAKETADRIRKLVLQKEDRFESRHKRKDGSLYDVEVSIQYQNTAGGQFIVFLHDITEQKREKQILMASEERFRNLIWDMQVGVLLQDAAPEIVLCNPKALEFFGISEDQLLGKTSFDPDWNVIHEDGTPFPGPTHPIPQAIATRKPVRDVVMGVYRPSYGDRIWLQVHALPQLHADGTIQQVVCTFIDISIGKQAEQALHHLNEELETRVAERTAELEKINNALRQTEEKYRLLSENITDGIFILKKGHFEYINKAMHQIFGYGIHELLEKKLVQLFSPDYQQELIKFLSTNKETNEIKTIEVECLRKDQSTVFVEILLNYVAVEKAIYGVIHDITEQKQLQKNIVKAIIQTEEKERAFFSKELHDGLGPLLSTIKLYLQWSQRPKSNKSQAEVLHKAEDILEEALSTVKEISNKLSPHLLINYGLTSAIQSFVDKIGETSVVKINFSSNTSRRYNLEIEAAYYRATIECISNSLKHAHASLIEILLNDCTTHLQLEYKDNGKGFIIAKAMEAQKGLGLFNLQNRIQTIGGKIKMSSRPKKGVAYQIIVNL